LASRVIVDPFEYLAKEVLGELGHLGRVTRAVTQRGAGSHATKASRLGADHAVLESPQEHGDFDPHRAIVRMRLVEHEEAPGARCRAIEKRTVPGSQQQVLQHRVVRDQDVRRGSA